MHCMARTFFILLLVGLAACQPSTKDKFDRTAMLTALYDDLIQPDYNEVVAVAQNLKNKQVEFLANVNLTSLNDLKSAYTSAYITFQKIEVYSFSTERELRTTLNSFPADTTQILSNLSSGTYNLEAVNNIRAKGFPALDFLLYGKDEAATLTAFSTQTNRQNYLANVVDDVVARINQANTVWAIQRQAFVNASGTDVGSSLGILVNDISLSLEFCRRERVGNALGYVGIIFSGVKAPEKLEAIYSRQSKEVLIAHLQHLRKIYSNGNQLSFDDYLDYLNAQYNGTPLSNTIANQFDVAIQAAQNVPSDFETALSAHPAEMETLFLELKKLVVLVKVDMSSSLGVIINYSDNDGD